MSRKLLLLCGLMLWSAGSASATPKIGHLLDVRVRQEILDGVFHFAADPDHNWLRVRSRAGLRCTADRGRIEVRLVNEHRRHLVPDRVFDWDELILDRALWSWKITRGAVLTVGRQDIIWNRGFLMLEARPYDGSRSICHDAVRLQFGSLDLAFIRNLKRDHLVLAGDQQRALRDMDETALAVRGEHERLSWSFIWKDETDPAGVLADLETMTFALRYEGVRGRVGTWLAELAVQQQFPGSALAGQAFLTEPVGWNTTAELGGFYYSGASAPEGYGFRTPWGRWPKWSELYIYTLLGESTPGRPAVAAWENIAGLRGQFRRPVGRRVAARLGLNWLLAPEPGGETRGLLTQAELTTRLGGNWTGHLLWEMLVPGAFHDGRHDLPPLTDTVHFLRWQVAWAL